MVSERFETWTERWERQGMEKGMRKGLQQGLLRQARKRFGAEVAERSVPLLARIDDPERLEDLGEALLDSADGEGWLRVLHAMAGEP